jgi:hypothetical protein
MEAFDYDDVPNWRGREVQDRHGHPFGMITDIYVDDLSQRPEWIEVKSGVFSHHKVFVPVSGATLHGNRVRVSYDSRYIHDGPRFDPEGHLTVKDEAALYEHYGLDYDPAAASGSDSEYLIPVSDEQEEARRSGHGHRARLRKHAPGE